jgi:hypothetical protein
VCSSGATVTLLDASQPDDYDEWLRLWRDWEGRSVFAHPGYALTVAGADEHPVCWLWRLAETTVLLPLMIRPLASLPWMRDDEDVADAISPYGYGGPFVVSDDASSAQASVPDYLEWCRANRVVTTFIRLSLFAPDLAPLGNEAQPLRPNVVRSLQPTLDEIWMDCEHKVRKNVKRASREGVTVTDGRRGELVEHFCDIYRSTMARRGASADYRHVDASYMDRLLRRLEDNARIFVAYQGDRPVSAELVLLSARVGYSYLGGTLASHYHQRPNDLLKWEIIGWLKANGFRDFVLGGGFEADDGIFQYKKSFAPQGMVPFQVVRWAHDQSEYERLNAVRLRAAGHAQAEGFFPLYRAPSAAALDA